MSKRKVVTHDTIADQRLRHAVPVTQPLVMCSQIQRSGGTLLLRLLDGHPSCFVHPSELRWDRLHPWPEIDLSAPLDPDTTFDAIVETWPAKFGTHGYEKFSNWTKEQHPEQIKRYPFLFDTALQRRLFAAALDRAGATRRDVLNAYLTSLFNAWLDYQNLYSGPKQWVAAFEPRLAVRSSGPGPFFADYPDGRLVTIVREPGAWLSSYTRHTGDADATRSLRLWSESVERSLTVHTDQPGRVLVVVFEQLVTDTATVMRQVAAWLGIPFMDSLLQPTYNSMPVLSDSSHELSTGIDTQVTERHKAATSDADAALLAADATPRYERVKQQFWVGGKMGSGVI